ncbi:MAG: hypothetical protein R3321_11175, partial [Nitrososphaeraceae archaeon]|nr:hypothetical protein [Nitrososphaeraceae archaeon]
MNSYKTKDKYAFIKPKIVGSIDSITYPALAQVKYDGEICMAVISNSVCKLYSEPHIGRVRTHCPITTELLSAGYDNSILLGELYYGDGKNLFQFLMHKTSDDLKFAVFDIIKYKGKSIKGQPLSERMSTLRYIRDLQHVHLADSIVCYNSN